MIAATMTAPLCASRTSTCSAASKARLFAALRGDKGAGADHAVPHDPHRKKTSKSELRLKIAVNV